MDFSLKDRSTWETLFPAKLGKEVKGRIMTEIWVDWKESWKQRNLHVKSCIDARLGALNQRTIDLQIIYKCK
jgi:hypothetical protein